MIFLPALAVIAAIPLGAQTPKLGFAAWLGGAGYDAVLAMVADSGGFVYVTGETASPAFSGCAGPTPARGRDVFVAKFTPGGTKLVYCAVLGGTGNDAGRAIAVDSQGNAYVAGSTNSTDFPVTQGAYRPATSGQGEAFVAKISPAGLVLYSTLIGGSGIDAATAVGVDSAGFVFVGGYTTSYDFPVTPGALQVSPRGSTDGFLAKVNASGSGLVYATYLGGNSMDGVNALQAAADGSVWAAGYTESPDFPGGVQQRLRDGFVVQLDRLGATLSKALSVTGMGEDSVNALYLNPAGLLTAGGSTSSPDFPTTPGAAQAVKRAGRDGFVCQWNLPAATVKYCTLIGGAGADSVSALATTPDGRIWAAGSTSSIDFPTVNPVQGTAGSTLDSWVAALNAAGSAWTFSSYLRGASDDAAAALAAAGQRVWVAGSTMSADFPATGEGVQSAFGGNTDGWLLRLTEASGPEILAVSPTTGTGADQLFTFEIGIAGGVGRLDNFSINFSDPLSFAQSCHVTAYASSQMVSLLGDSGASYVAQGTPGSALLLRNSQCSIDMATASLRAAGNTLTVSLRISFAVAFASLGSSADKRVHVLAVDRSGNSTGWVTCGIWRIPFLNVAPTLASLTPNQGSGMAQHFRFVLHDDNGARDLRTISVVIGSTLHWDRACFFTFWTANNILGLANDTATAYVAGLLPGVAGIIANSSCSLNAAESSVVVNGTQILLDVSVSFLPGFTQVDGSAAKKIYTYVGDASGASTNWTLSGDWTVAASSVAPTVAPLSANSTGTGAVIAFRVSDAEGQADIAFVTLNVSAPLQSASACVVTYVAANGRLALLNDAGTGYLGDLIPGGSGQLSNSQCTLDAASSVVWGTGKDLYLRVALNLTAAFAASNGPVKGIYVAATDRNWASLPWTRIGTWATPSANAAPTMVSVTPASGTGSLGVFTLTARDSNGAQDLSNLSVVISNPLGWQNSCFFTVFTESGILALADDSGYNYVAVLLPGSQTSMANSQCEIRADMSRFERDDYQVRITVAIAFKGAYAASGATKRIHVYAVDRAALNTGWLTFGSWTIQ